MIGVHRVNALKKPIMKGDTLTMKFKSSDAINQRIERISTNHLIIGIDIAKEKHVAGAVNFRGIQLGRTLAFSNTQEGFQKLMKWVRHLQKSHGLTQVLFGAESTGHYFLNLAFWLHEHKEEIVLVNPLTTKRNKENRDNRPSKNDDKDAIIIGDSISRGYYSDWVIHDLEYRKLRCLVNEREGIAVTLTALGNRIQNALDQVFPEFTSVFGEWNCPRGLATLKAFPLPSEIKEHTIEQIIQQWREKGMMRAGGIRGRAAAATLLCAARSSVGLRDIAQEMKAHILRLIETYELTQLQKEALDREIEGKLYTLPESVLKPLQAVGLSSWLVAVILANSGDLSHYAHGRQLLALAGLSLAESQSGKRKGQIVICKRGRRQLRKYLYLAVVGLVSNHPQFKAWHDDNVNKRKMKKQRSIFKLIGKLARIMVSLAHSGEQFDPVKPQPLLPQAA